MVFLKANLGDYVMTWFDTGAMGAKMIWGVVTKSGPKAVAVTWESDLTNRVRRDDPRGVEDVRDVESIDPTARRRLVAHLPTKKCTDRKCDLAATPHRHLVRESAAATKAIPLTTPESQEDLRRRGRER